MQYLKNTPVNFFKIWHKSQLELNWLEFSGQRSLFSHYSTIHMISTTKCLNVLNNNVMTGNIQKIKGGMCEICEIIMCEIMCEICEIIMFVLPIIQHHRSGRDLFDAAGSLFFLFSLLYLPNLALGLNSRCCRWNRIEHNLHLFID